MNPTNFQLVYELDASSLYKTLAVALFLTVVLLGALSLTFVEMWRKGLWHSILFIAVIGCVIVALIPIFEPYIENIDMVRAKKFSYVEGSVQNFSPMPYNGHAVESFTVSGVPFQYSDYSVAPGFHNTASHGGPIREGLYVRIWHIGNEITKLEIAQPAQSQ